MAFRIPSTDYEQRRPDPGVTEEEFDKGAALLEGINGWDRMHTRFENTERTQVIAPRGDKRGRPMPRDAKFLGADNHGEWGADQPMHAWERGMDGPIETRQFYGAGLPKREDLMPCANPQFYSPLDEGEGPNKPMDQAIGAKEP